MLHKNHEQLVAKLKLRANVYIHGPTGSGKTAGIKKAASECNLPFYKKLLGNQTSEASIIGYMSANGDYVKGIAYDAFTQGGVLCMDEIDNGNPNTTLVCNGLADREFAFPCGMREAHKDFVLVATANTIGTGATLQYCGRNRLDAAMLNRFEFIEWNYDNQLEHLIAEHNATATANEFNSPRAADDNSIKLLVNDIQRFRQALEQLNINHIISPRNTIQAANALMLKRPMLEIIKSILFKGIDRDTIKRVFETSEKILKESKSSDSNMVIEQAANEKLAELEQMFGGVDKLQSIIAIKALNKAKNNPAYSDSKYQQYDKLNNNPWNKI